MLLSKLVRLLHAAQLIHLSLPLSAPAEQTQRAEAGGEKREGGGF
jgi:hypothetical protein